MRTDSKDSTEIVNAVKNKREGRCDVELIMTPSGEMIAVPASQVDNMDGVIAGTIATEDYY